MCSLDRRKCLSERGADPAKTAVLCLFHDTQETRIGDVPSVGKAYVVTAPNPEVTTDQVAGFPAEAGQDSPRAR